jgi:hypothetical protein
VEEAVGILSLQGPSGRGGLKFSALAASLSR